MGQESEAKTPHMVDDQEEHKPGLEVELDYMTERPIPVMPPVPKLL